MPAAACKATMAAIQWLTLAIMPTQAPKQFAHQLLTEVLYAQQATITPWCKLWHGNSKHERPPGHIVHQGSNDLTANEALAAC